MCGPATRRCCATLQWRPHASLEQTRAQLDWDQARWLKRRAWTWLLVDAQGEAQMPVGLVQLVPQQLEGPAHHLRLGYLLARSHWGRGLMREALTVVIDEVFAHEAVWRVDAVCDLGNPASARVLQAVGFAQEGVLRRHSLHPNASAEPRDVALYARCSRQAEAGGS